MAFVFVVAGHSSRLAQSHHGLWHASSIYQFVHGITPITNPLSLGAPANYLSAYYALLARLVWILDVTPFEASLLVNGASFGVWLAMGWWAAGRFTRAPALRLAAGLLPFLLVNPLGPLAYLLHEGSSGIELLGRGQPDVRQFLPVEHLLGVPLEFRVAVPFAKFLNFNGQPLGMALLAVGLHGVALATHVGRAALVAAASGFLASVFYPPAGLALGLVAGAAVGVEGLGWLAARAPRGGVARLLPGVALGLGVLAAAPIVASEAANLSQGFGLRVGPGRLLDQAVRQGFGLWQLLLLLALATPALRRGDFALRLYALATLVFVAANLFFVFPRGTEYKFAHFAGLPAAILLVGLLGRRADRTRSLAWGLLTVALLPVVTLAWLYLRSDWARQDPYVYRGRTIDLAVEAAPPEVASRQQALAWIREHTAPEAYVLERPVRMNHLELSALTQRRVVAARPHRTFTARLPHHRELADASAAVVEGLAQCALGSGALERLFDVPVAWPDLLYAFAERRQPGDDARCEQGLPPGVRVAHTSRLHRVFEIRR